jgi:3,5-dioxohexanoate:acetyl-CoA acetone transferase
MARARALVIGAKLRSLPAAVASVGVSAARERSMPQRKVVITCAVTGSIHTPSMSPHLPVAAEEIAQAAIGAAEAGAAIVHLHARDPADGRPDQSPERFAPFLGIIKQRTNCVVNITTGGAATMTIEERLRPVAEFKPEVASLNMGSMNFGLYPMLQRFKDFKHDWERPYLEGSRDRIFKNTFADIEKILTTCADNGTRFEIECYDIGHLYTLAHFVDRGLVTAPFFVQSVFGILGGIGGHPEDVMHMRRTADRLFGADYHWSALGAGRNQMTIAAQAIALGGNIRVGLEDSLWIGPGRLARSNAEQVAKARRLVEEFGFEVATPDEARAILALKGGDRVAF